jgi:predicted nucleic acid-binding protein
MVTLDTSALIRFFTNDIPSKARKVKRLLEGGEKIVIPEVVFPELEYVLLGKSYNANRKKIYKAFQFLAINKKIVISDEVKRAIEIYAETKLDIADCIIASYALGNKLFSFDKDLLRIKGVKTYEFKNSQS